MSAGHTRFLSLLAKFILPAITQLTYFQPPPPFFYNTLSFNQALGVPFGADPKATTLWSIESFSGYEGKGVATTKACYGCTAADGSSCSGALKKA